MKNPGPLPLSATMSDEERDHFHETIPLMVSAWGVSRREYDALVGNLDMTNFGRLSMKQHRRLSALIEIAQKLPPTPICYDDASADVLRHPLTAPCGTRPALDVMCTGLDELEAVASYFKTLPHGPWLLPGILHDFLEAWQPDTRWYIELMEEAESMGTQARYSLEDPGLARTLSEKLREVAASAPASVRTDLLRCALASRSGVIFKWAADLLSETRVAKKYPRAM